MRLFLFRTLLVSSKMSGISISSLSNLSYGLSNSMSNVVLKTGGIVTGALTVNGTLTGTSLAGNGASVSNLNGSYIASGTVSSSWLPTATISQKGVVQLSDSATTTSSNVAATSTAVKAAYDLANSAKTTADTASTIATSASNTANAALPKSGGNLTGNLTFANGTNLLWKNVSGNDVNILRVDNTNCTKLFTGGSTMFINGDGGLAMTSINYNTTGAFAMYHGTSAVMYKPESSSFLGINYTSPAYQLDVWGNVGIRNSAGPNIRLHLDTTANNSWKIGMDTGYALCVYRNSDSIGVYLAWGTTGWAANSDIRLKQNIVSLPDPALPSVLQLRPVHYNWKTDSNSEAPRVGFIAQEVQNHFPKVVHEKDGLLSITMTDMIPYLVKAIQEQQEDIILLKQQVNELSTRTC